jgi:hypothetical protein
VPNSEQGLELPFEFYPTSFLSAKNSLGPFLLVEGNPFVTLSSTADTCFANSRPSGKVRGIVMTSATIIDLVVA